MNIDFLKQLMTSDCYYWLVAKECHASSGRGLERIADDILLVGIPYENRPYKLEDIRLLDLEKFQKMEIPANIFISEPFPPFQTGQTLYRVYSGMPLNDIDITSFMIEALQLKSKSLWDYKPLIDKHTKKEI